MRVPLNWLKEYVNITIPVPDLAERLTYAGLEVNSIEYIGLPPPMDLSVHTRGSAVKTGLVWDREKVVIAAVSKVKPHPQRENAVILHVNDGRNECVAVSSAPNLFAYKSSDLDKPIKVPLVKIGGTVYDSHKEITTTERAVVVTRQTIAGVESNAIVCSERELGISADHEGVIIFDDDAPVGGSLADYIGDIVLDLDITPNMARNASIIGVAREVAALTGQELRLPSYDVVAVGKPIDGYLQVEILERSMNPRFMASLIRGVTIKPSPYWLQLRLRLALNQRPINNIVDITNYVMVETGQPLHAFDYDKLVERADGNPPKIITRLAQPGERLKTLDNEDRRLDPFTILVTDTKGGLSLGGVMGGAETEVSSTTTNVLLESAAWEFINIRQTIASQKLQSSEAGYRFSRGVHPAMAERGLRRGTELTRQLGDGQVAQGVVDIYPGKSDPIVLELQLSSVERILGFHLRDEEITQPLESLGFQIETLTYSASPDAPKTLRVTVPDHRLDIGLGLSGEADLIEEIARMYGYDRISETQLSDQLPPQTGNLSIETEERLRDILVTLGMQEVITYRLTVPQREQRLSLDDSPIDSRPYITLANPISSDRVVMRHSLLASVLEVAAENLRFSETLRLFEIGPVFLPDKNQLLPNEPRQLVLVLTGPREPVSWQGTDRRLMDFYDLKAVINRMLAAAHVVPVYEPCDQPAAHAGRAAQILSSIEDSPTTSLGWIGELNPFVRRQFSFPDQPVIVADIDFEALLKIIPRQHVIREIPEAPAVKEDLAVVVEGTIPAAEVQNAIVEAAGELLADVSVFDIYSGDQIGTGKKSLGFRLTYQAKKRTLTDAEVAGIRAGIVKHLESVFGARLRG